MWRTRRGKINFVRQLDNMDCGAACLKMVAHYYGKSHSLDKLRDLSKITKEGVSLLGLSEAAGKIGFRALMVRVPLKSLVRDCPLPVILHWNQEHFIVLYKVSKNKFFIADPGTGLVTIDRETLINSWENSLDGKGVVLLLEPTPDFFSNPEEKANRDFKDKGFKFLLKYLKPYKKYVLQLIIGMAGASMISLVFPFLTQMLVDIGIKENNISVIYLILLSQVLLFFGSTAFTLIRSWLLLHINARISLNIISDFLIKLLKLPIRFFDTKTVGDISQRITDHHRIEDFLTGSVLNSLFSIVNLIIFSAILAFYHWKILAFFLAFSFLGILWVFFFQSKRKSLDYKRFAINKENQDKLFEMISGMQEIKLYGSETQKRWEWERLQVKNFKLNIQSLQLEQYQHTGYIFFTYLKNIIVTFIAVQEVLYGALSLGGLLSVSYIIGQTNGPIEQLINFIKSAQDAQLSMSRLQEVHRKTDEESENERLVIPLNSIEDIVLKDVSFKYDGPSLSPLVLDRINLTIPKGKITAIVGTSGSGKTTLMKLLLGFYKPIKGDILIGETKIEQISPTFWRSKCGTVMQDGYIFGDTIAKNIALSGEVIDDNQLKNAIELANLTDFIQGLPLSYTTKVGNAGNGISGGQRQRILLARALYKNPHYLFLDEATSALDAENEKIIQSNLVNYFEGRTVVVIAHRLSTVKNADQIVVLDKGKIVEVGDHKKLTDNKGKYYELVKNQLELGN